MRYFLASLTLFAALFADTLDDYYRSAGAFIDESLLAIDRYLGGEGEGKPKYRIDLYLETAFEDSSDPLYKVGVNARIVLPRTERKLRLIFEDFQKKEDVDSATTDKLTETIDDRDYLLGIEYLRRSPVHLAGGVKVRGFDLDPYIGLKSSTSLGANEEWSVGARVRYFLQDGLDAKIFLDYTAPITQDLTLLWYNSLRYEEEAVHYQEVHTLALARPVHKGIGTIGVTAYLADDKITDLVPEYYYIWTRYRQSVLKKWLYIEVGPGVMFRKENSYDPTLRITFRLGVKWRNY